MIDFQSNYDRFLLAALALAAVAVSVLVAASASEARGKAVLPAPGAKQERYAGDPAVALLKSDRSALSAHKEWSEGKASTFVSRIYLLKDGRLVDILESGNELFPGIPNAWVLEHGLNYLDAELPDRDPDNDGFSNREEFTAKTNPSDGSSKPEDWTKLRLADVKIEQMKIIYTGRDFKDRAAINSIAATSDDLATKKVGPTKYYMPGDTIIVAKYRPGYSVTYEEEKTPFRLAGFKTEKRENARISVDGKPKIDEIQFAVLESASGDGTKVELEANKEQTSPYSLASLLDTKPGGATISARTGESFALGASGRYKLVDVSEEAATIENLATGERHVIPKGTPSPEPAATPEEAKAP